MSGRLVAAQHAMQRADTAQVRVRVGGHGHPDGQDGRLVFEIREGPGGRQVALREQGRMGGVLQEVSGKEV